MNSKIIYYEDELNDEFAIDNIKPKTIGDDYKYIRKSIFKKITRFFWYRIVATPIAFIYLKLKFRHKIVNKKIIKKCKEGFFLYGNHTNQIPDALIPTMIITPKQTYAIVHANNVSMPILGKITPSLGALPLPDTRGAYKNFKEAINYHIGKKRCINIYPEAHVWPYYTKIRPFVSTSFKYPVDLNAPVFCFVNTYQKRKHSKAPKIVTYVDGPFYPKPELSSKENIVYLRDLVYNQMVLRSENSNYELIKYVKKQKEDIKE